jgi:hypothetical protein
VPAAISKYANAAIKLNATFVGIFIIILRTTNKSWIFFFCALCHSAIRTLALFARCQREPRAELCGSQDHRPADEWLGRI